MTYYVLEVMDHPDDAWLKRYFCREGMRPDFSRHGAAGENLCVTWDAAEVSLEGLRTLSGNMADGLAVQVRLVTDVIEPPWRMQPAMLDHGRQVAIWNEGMVPPSTWEHTELLPEITLLAIRQLLVEQVLDTRPHISQEQIEGKLGIMLTLRMYFRLRSRAREDRIYDVLEGTSTEEVPVRVRIIVDDPMERVGPAVRLAAQRLEGRRADQKG